MEEQEILNVIISRAKPGAMREDDYIDPETGILMCGVCHTPRQTKIGSFTVPCLCRCEAERREQDEAARRMARMRDAIEHSVLYDSVFSSFSFEADNDPESRPSIVSRRYVEHWPEMRDANQGILFFGEPGTGKTFYAGCIVNALRKQGVCAQMVSVTRLLMQLDAWEKEPALEAVKRVPLLVLDDVGAERGTAYRTEQLFTVIDARIQARLPLIVTTNLSPEELDSPDSLEKQRIFSRLSEACGVKLLVSGEKRRGISKTKAEDARRILLG